MIRDAQVSKAVWQSMSKENKTQIFYGELFKSIIWLAMDFSS